VAYPGDVAAGLALGRQVGERVVAWGRADGSDATWTGSVPTDPGMWSGTNPVEPLAGAWKPWALASGSQFRPDPSPALDSEQFARERAEVKNYPRTNLTNLTASYPSAHSVWSGAAGAMLGRLFPRAALHRPALSAQHAGHRAPRPIAEAAHKR
jgi:hypothetical protein